MQGLTVREHLERAAAVDPAAARELVGPPMPPVGLTAWHTFDALHRARPMSAQGVTPISYTELDAFRRLTGTPLTPLDVQLVRIIDEVYLDEYARAMAPEPTDVPPLEA
ncbi:MAG: hypothetical protein K2R93_12370 [Gemmatimonadaceae bacterium]|nr:hypothetical protein [Gemmatimonadaceae bacterium]